MNVPSACRRVRTLDKQISIIYGKGDIPPVRFNKDINNKLHLFIVPFKCKEICIFIQQGSIKLFNIDNKDMYNVSKDF